MTLDDAADRQRPEAGALVLDHVAHFLPDMAQAEAALDRLGFAPTPISHQMHRAEPGGPLVSAGTANRTAMLARGYLEFLATTGDTPNAAKLRAAMARYTGVHLVCFGTSEAAAGGSKPWAISRAWTAAAVSLQREVALEDGATMIARFTVLRAAPDRMREGRIQFVEHLTPTAIWQRRHLDHPNGARELAGIVVAVPDPEEATDRWSRLTGLPFRSEGALSIMDTARGRVIVGAAAAIGDVLGAAPPALPWIAGPIVGVVDLAATRALLARSGVTVLRDDAHRLVVAAPPALGGIYVFVPCGA